MTVSPRRALALLTLAATTLAPSVVAEPGVAPSSSAAPKMLPAH